MAKTLRRQLLATAAAGLVGCAAPQMGTAPTPAPSDVHAASALDAPRPEKAAPPTPGQPGKGPQPFELPATMLGADAPPLTPPRFAPGTSAADREKAVQSVYPQLAAPEKAGTSFAEGEPLSLAALQELALAQSPVLRRAQADVDASYGAAVQAGLYPNPTVGYQADQWQPRQRNGNAGQQGAFVNQTIRYPGKLGAAVAVAEFDVKNAQVAVRRAKVDVTNQVRSAYFAALVAAQAQEVNRSLIELADEVYRLQLRQVAGGEAAGYEPLQLYAQAVQARNTLLLSQTSRSASLRQLAAAIGRPDLDVRSLSGRADVPAPTLNRERLRARILAAHTDLVTARNAVDQAEANVRLQRLTPYPDLQANAVVQHDNSSGNKQFNLQLGIAIPTFDRNQGNILQATGQLARARAAVMATENDLLGRLAEAFGRYESNTVAVRNYREKVIPNLTRAYRALIRRYQAEPEKVGFNDIVVAQQSLGQAMQAYLQALDAQWRAVVDLGTLAQIDDLFETAQVDAKDS